jgi:hypothetical protein
VPQPPAEIHVIEKERWGKRGREPCDSDHDREVDSATGEEIRLECTQHEDREERDAERERDDGCRTRGCRNRRDDARKCHSDDAESDNGGDRARLESEQCTEIRRATQRRKRGQCEHCRTYRKGRRSGQGDDAVHADEYPRCGESVDSEQCGHDDERRADEDRTAVVPPHADDGEGERSDCSDEGTHTHADEVHLPPEHHHPVAVEAQEAGGQKCPGAEQHEEGRETIAEEEPHRGSHRPC